MHCLQLKNQGDNEEISPQNVHDVDEKIHFYCLANFKEFDLKIKNFLLFIKTLKNMKKGHDFMLKTYH